MFNFEAHAISIGDRILCGGKVSGLDFAERNAVTVNGDPTRSAPRQVLIFSWDNDPEMGNILPKFDSHLLVYAKRGKNVGEPGNTIRNRLFRRSSQVHNDEMTGLS